MNPSITRAALIQAIEAGIASARILTPVEKLALRLVGLTATEVGIGTFDICPAAQAGLASPNGNWTHAGLFAGGFDRVIDSLFPQSDKHDAVSVTD